MAKRIKSVSDEKPQNSSAVEIGKAIAAMYYLSESEAPLELQPWLGIKNLAALQQKIEVETHIPVAEQQVQSPEDFLKSIRLMATPADGVMMQYAADWEALFASLRKLSTDIQIVQGGKAPVQIYIAAFAEAAFIIIHTTADQT